MTDMPGERQRFEIQEGEDDGQDFPVSHSTDLVQKRTQIDPVEDCHIQPYDICVK